MNAKGTDVVIIGGGIMGCSMAYRLAQRGLTVVVLERGQVGEEASGRNGGGVRQQNRDRAELPLALEAVKIWANMKDELDWDVGYRVGGNLRLVTSEEEHRTFFGNPEWEREMGLEVEWVTAKEARELAPALSKDEPILGATYCPTDGTANPLLATKAIARAARRAGAELREHEPVTGLKVEADRVVAVLTERGEYRGSLFVNAAGPWARTVCNWLGLDYPIRICRAQIVVTEALPPTFRQFISFDVGYLRQAIEGQVHLGVRSQTVENYDKRTNFQAFKDIGHRFTELFPFLRNATIIRSWGGLTNWTPDSIPIIDKAPNLENFYLLAGFSGHGFCLGPLIGKLMAEWLAEGRPSMDLSAFRWTRFPEIYLPEDRKG